MAYITDPVFIQEHLSKLIAYNWEAEVKNFEETFSEEIDEDLTMEEIIEQIEEIEGGTDHILYSLAVVSVAFSEDEEEDD